MPGTEVRVSRDGDKVVLEPIRRPPFDIKAWRAELRALGAAEFLAEGIATTTSRPPRAGDPDMCEFARVTGLEVENWAADA